MTYSLEQLNILYWTIYSKDRADTEPQSIDLTSSWLIVKTGNYTGDIPVNLIQKTLALP